MSGGHFQYKSREPGKLADAIEEDLDRLAAEEKPEPPEIEAAMRYCVAQLRSVGELARAIEWYMSGDSGPESVLDEHRRMVDAAKAG